MSTIIIDEQEISRGCFSVFADAMVLPQLEPYLLEMEKYYFTDRAEFAENMRYALEAFIQYEYLRLYPEDRSNVIENLRIRMQEQMRDHPYAGRTVGGMKLFLLHRCCNTQMLQSKFLHKALECWNPNARKDLWNVRNMILDVFGFANDAHHLDVGETDPERWIETTRENCEQFLDIFYYLLRGYCQFYYPEGKDLSKLGLKKDLLPLEGYIPITNTVSGSLRLEKAGGARYYIREEKDDKTGTLKIRYYLGWPKKEGVSNRTNDALQRLWDRSNDYRPRNIVDPQEVLRIDDEESVWMYALPDRPRSLKPEMIPHLTLSQRKKLFRDAQRAISYLHNSEPPLYHRDICPEAFLVFPTKNGYKLELRTFDCVKDTDENVDYTVHMLVRERAEKSFRQYRAPELNWMEDADAATLSAAYWEQADLYSLGVLGIFLLTGKTAPEELDAIPLEDHIRQHILALCGPAGSRPSLEPED